MLVIVALTFLIAKKNRMNTMFKRVETDQELQGLLDLQLANHKDSLSEEKKKEIGFVTVKHTFKTIKKMHDIEPSVIGVLNGKVVSYAIAMTTKSKEDIPVLVPMFETFDKLSIKDKKLNEFNYLVVGQVCVGEEARGTGAFKKMYEFYRNAFQEKYDFCITEIDVKNTRSIQAHKKIGFEMIHNFTDINDITWDIVVWNWRRFEV